MHEEKPEVPLMHVVERHEDERVDSKRGSVCHRGCCY